MIGFTTPLGNDEAKVKRFYGLPGGDLFNVPLMLAGMRAAIRRFRKSR